MAYYIQENPLHNSRDTFPCGRPSRVDSSRAYGVEGPSYWQYLCKNPVFRAPPFESLTAAKEFWCYRCNSRDRIQCVGFDSVLWNPAMAKYPHRPEAAFRNDRCNPPAPWVPP